MLKQAGFTAAFSLTQERSLPLAEPMNISRFNVAPEDTIRSLMFRWIGIHSMIPFTRRSGKRA